MLSWAKIELVISRTTINNKIIPACVLTVVLIFNVILVTLLIDYKEVRVNARGNEYFVKIGELYNHPENMQLLYDILLGEENTEYQNIYEAAKTLKGGNFFREKNYKKNVGQNIIITFGGLEWQVCCLSLTGEEDDVSRTPILTIMLSDALTLSKFQTWAAYDHSDLVHPANMYGTSYMRAVTLNNGGQYASDLNTLINVQQDGKNQFAVFTMRNIENSVTDAIVKPSEVKWQETQSALAMWTYDCNLFNEAWGIPAGGNILEWNAVSDYVERIGNDMWKYDCIWLPSYTELVLWQFESEQRCCGYKYWLRSALQNSGCSTGIMQIDEDGEMDYQAVHDGGCYVLPALHLNLDADSLRTTRC